MNTNGFTRRKCCLKAQYTANGWYITGWCGQFEKGAVLIPRQGEAWLLVGPESEPFAKMSAAVKNTRSFPVFMVPDEEYPNAEIIDFKQLNRSG